MAIRRCIFSSLTKVSALTCGRGHTNVATPSRIPSAASASKMNGITSTDIGSSNKEQLSYTSLEETLLLGRRMGLLTAKRKDVAAEKISPPYSCCTGAESNPFSTEWKPDLFPWESYEEVQRKQLIVYRASQSNDKFLSGLLPSHVNHISIEATVDQVEFGAVLPGALEAAREAWDGSTGEKTRRHSIEGNLAALPLAPKAKMGGKGEAVPMMRLRLWLLLPVQGNEDVTAPLALHCPLSAAVVQDLSSLTFPSPLGKNSSESKGVEAACVKFFESALGKKRVIVTGQLRMEERYDGDLHRIVQVPYISLPMDSFEREIRLVDKIMGQG